MIRASAGFALLASAWIFASGVSAAQPPPPAPDARRVAILVGANRGAEGQQPLHYSYLDAESLADVLEQVGGFLPDDVHVLKDPEPDAVLFTLDRELKKMREAGGESLLVFYYSGHADGRALYPGGKPLAFSELRKRLESPDATVRLGIVDACGGGGWTGSKGVATGAPFVVDVPLELSGEGSALVASSSGTEEAHESEQLRGSYFTHHFVAGLRGAADSRGTGLVTLSDAFAYAEERTVRDSAELAREPQHPSFSMNLRGRSDLPLSRVAVASSVVELQMNEGPIQIIHLPTGLIVLEVPSGKRTVKLALAPGRYLVRRQLETGSFSREITVGPGGSLIVRESELLLSGDPAVSAKAFGRSGVLAWPLAYAERPLTLFAGMTEVDAALGWQHQAYPEQLLIGQSYMTFLIVSDSLNQELSVKYGFTDRLTAGVSLATGECVSTDSCVEQATRGAAMLSILALPGEVLQLAPTITVSLQNGAGLGLGGAIPIRLRVPRVAFTLTPSLSWVSVATLPKSGFLSGNANAANLASARLGQSVWQVNGELAVQPLERLSLILAGGVAGLGPPVRASDDAPSASMDAGALFALSHRLDLRLDASYGISLDELKYGKWDYGVKVLQLSLAVRL